MKAAVRHWIALSAGAALAIGSSMTSVAHGATQPPANPSQSQASGENAAQGRPMLDMVAAQAELKDSINAKKAKQGEVIRVRITQKVKFSDGKELPVETILGGTCGSGAALGKEERLDGGDHLRQGSPERRRGTTDQGDASGNVGAAGSRVRRNGSGPRCPGGRCRRAEAELGYRPRRT